MDPVHILERLTRVLSRLPGVGKRSAERMALRLAREPDSLAAELERALREVREQVCCCSLCGTVTSMDRNPCRLCADAGRDDTLLCVVEDSNDIVQIERSGGYRGRYHALGGRLSLMRGEGPEDLRLKPLLERVRAGTFREVVLALNTDVESDATAAMVADLLSGEPVIVTRLASGLPAGSGIGYSDPVTLLRAMKGRQVL